MRRTGAGRTSADGDAALEGGGQLAPGARTRVSERYGATPGQGPAADPLRPRALPAGVDTDLRTILPRERDALTFGYLQTLSLPYRTSLAARLDDPADDLGQLFHAHVEDASLEIVRRILAGTTVDVGDYGQDDDREPFAGSLDVGRIELDPDPPQLNVFGFGFTTLRVRGTAAPADLRVNIQTVRPDGSIAPAREVAWNAGTEASEDQLLQITDAGTWAVIVEVAEGHRALRRMRREVEVVPLLGAGPGAAAGPAPAAVTTTTLGGGNLTVVRGDTLWSIADEVYGEGRYWRAIRDENRDRVYRGGNLIHPGTVLTLPSIEVPIGEAIESFRDDPEELRNVVSTIPEASYEAYLAGLSEDERQAQGELLQLVELMRTTGMTVEELADEQRRFLEGEAARQGMTVGEYINERVDRRGYGGATATWWPSLTDAEKADWRRRFREAVAAVRSAATPDVTRVIDDAEAQGGGIRFEPELSEELGAFGFTRGDWTLYVGRRWVEAAESDPTSVFANVVHEMGGHNEYGSEIGGAIMGEVMDDLPQDERDRATASGNSVFSAYAYMETEIWAELREHEHDDERNPSDHPTGDVSNQLNQIRVAFAPAVAQGLIRSMWRRILLDSRITASARGVFRENVRLVFELDLGDS